MLIQVVSKNQPTPSIPAHVANKNSSVAANDLPTSQTDDLNNRFSSLQIMTLIKAVQKRPVLYDGHLGRSNRNAGKKAWDEIAQLMDSDVQTCQNKWKNLRDIFVKKKRAKDTNPGMYNLRPWPLMEAMMFVEPYIGNPRGPTDQKKDKEDTIPTQVTTMFQNRKYKLKESNGGVYVLEEQSEDSPEDSQLHIIKLGDVLGNQSQETIDSHDVASAQSPSTYEHPSTSYEIGESTVEIPSDGNGEISMLPKRRRKNETTEDILESAITKLVNESSEPQEDYLDLRTKSLCLLIRSRNLSLDDQVNIMRQCDELVLNYKKSS